MAATGKRVRFIHWKAGEAKERIERLRAMGYRVDYDALSMDLLRAMRDDPPSAVVIDLARLPSHGRDVALALRETKATRAVPIVFVGGEPEKVERIRSLLPDATFSSWPRLPGALRAAIARPPKEPVVPASRMAGYSGTPLPKKLGIGENATVVLIDAPKDFARTLGSLPRGARLSTRPVKDRGLTIWFCPSAKRYQANIRSVAAALGAGGLWVAWPKKASGVESDMSEKLVREVGLAHGLVDYKICAIDATWSGLKFAVRGEKKRR
jgi:hypothetical protein